MSVSDFVLPNRERRAIPIIAPNANLQTGSARSINTTGTDAPNTTAPTTHSAKITQSTSDALLGHTITSESNLDIFAPNYTPPWLKAVNESNADIIPCTPFPRLDFVSYIAAFIGSDFVNPVRFAPVPPATTTPPFNTTIQFQNYPLYWMEHLQNEFAAQSLQHRSFALYSKKLQNVPDRPEFFELHVPGLRENAPRVDLGDIIYIRLLCPSIEPDIENKVRYWLRFGQHQGAVCPGFTGLIYDPQVWEINRVKECVVLRINRFVNTSRCNVIFPLQESKLEPICRAVQSVFRHGAWLRTMLFPEANHGVPQTTLSRGHFDIDWFDELNYEQKKAVHAILSANYGPIPYLISGPPGTGKTKTLVETALQLINRPGHVLICAPSDAAADTLALRLSAHLQPQDLFRLNGSTRTFAEVPDRLMLYTHANDLSFTLPTAEKLLSFRVVVTTCRDADILNCARLTNTSLAPLFEGVTRVFAHKCPPAHVHWTALLLDEAAQATEPDTLIPLTVVAPPDNKQPPLFVAAGDQYQLGPKLVSKSPLGVSLFQRLFERKAYQDHPLSRKFGIRTISAKLLPMMRPAFTNLVRNYRSHPAILSVPSSLFYHDSLIPERKSSKEVSDWSGWSSVDQWPVLFHQNDSEDDYESITAGDGTGTGTLFNIGEINLAVQVVQSLLDEIGPSILAQQDEMVISPDSRTALQQNEIMVMSPFRAQVSRLRQAFRREKLYDINIGPLEAFQGLESRIVIICTTRTRLGTSRQMPNHYVSLDQARGLGVIDEPQRLNMAMTRAQEGLIVIGNAHCLVSTHDNQWLNFLDFCKRNDCYTSPYEFDWPNLGGPHTKGRLERALIYASMGKADAQARSKKSTNSIAARSKFALKGPQREMDEEMWQFKELAQVQDSEDIDLVIERRFDQEPTMPDNAEVFQSMDDDYDRDLRAEVYQECSAQ